MDKTTKAYRRNLPHFLPDGYVFFVTTRLAGTIPKFVVDQFQKEREKELGRINSIKDIKKKHQEYKTLQAVNFLKYEKYLENESRSSKWLSQNNIAKIVADTLHKFNSILYDLIAYTIMPNHIHLVILPIVERDSSRSSTQGNDETNEKEKSIDINIDQQFPPLVNIMKRIRGSTARFCNFELGRSGEFWQHESYDHVIRQKDELQKIVTYVLNNPVKAGLTDTYENWKWNYLNKEFLI